MIHFSTKCGWCKIRFEMKNRIKVGVIGFGYWGKIFTKQIENNTLYNLQWVVDPQESNRIYQGRRIFNSLENLLIEDRVDIVFIFTPPATHYQLAKSVILEKIDVLISKPITSNFQECKMLIDLAEENGVKIFEDHTFIFSEALKTIQNLISKNEIGTIRTFTSNRSNAGIIRSDVDVIQDLVTHDLAIIQKLFSSQVIKIIALSKNKNKPKPFNRNIFLILELDNGVIVNLISSWNSGKKIRQIQIEGDAGSISWDDTLETNKILLSKFEFNYETDTIQSVKNTFPKVNDVDTIQNELFYIANTVKGVLKHSHSMILEVNHNIKTIQENVYGI
jgi:predicted dehydrogenase